MEARILLVTEFLYNCDPSCIEPVSTYLEQNQKIFDQVYGCDFTSYLMEELKAVGTQIKIELENKNWIGDKIR